MSVVCTYYLHLDSPVRDVQGSVQVKIFVNQGDGSKILEINVLSDDPNLSMLSNSPLKRPLNCHTQYI